MGGETPAAQVSPIITVRRLSASDDLASAVHLLQRFFREEGFETAAGVIAENARKMAGLDVCGLFVAEVQGAAVGVATVSLEFGIEYGWSAEMGDLYVLPEWRGRGCSRALLQAVEQFLVERSAAGYQVTMTAHAAEAHGLANYYAKLGFAGEGRMILFKTLVGKSTDGDWT